ncbi:yjeF N-terminal domain-containing protein 3 isoform 2-T2 [Geothlypis trichas]
MSSAPCPSREPPRYLSQAEAEAMEKELLEDYRFGRQQLIEIWGHACAVAVTKAFPLRSLRRRQPTLLVACGPAQNGAVGLVCARHLRSFVALPGPAAPRLHHAVREDGHPVPVLPARRGAAHQRRLQRRGGRGAGSRGDTGDRGDRAVRGHPGHPQARPHPHRQPGCPLRCCPCPPCPLRCLRVSPVSPRSPRAAVPVAVSPRDPPVVALAGLGTSPDPPAVALAGLGTSTGNNKVPGPDMTSLAAGTPGWHSRAAAGQAGTATTPVSPRPGRVTLPGLGPRRDKPRPCHPHPCHPHPCHPCALPVTVHGSHGTPGHP